MGSVRNDDLFLNRLIDEMKVSRMDGVSMKIRSISITNYYFLAYSLFL